jgi:hypothetical protein
MIQEQYTNTNTHQQPYTDTNYTHPSANIQQQPYTDTNYTPPSYPILIIYELNRFRKVNGIYAVSTVDIGMCEVASWMEETIFYGSIVDSFFVMEDVLYYKGASMRNVIFKEKMEIMTYILSLSDYFDWISPSQSQQIHPQHTQQTDPQYATQHSQHTHPSTEHREFMGKMKLVSPVFFQNVEQTTIDISTVPYPIHHIQYRSINLLKPILNVSIARNGALGFKSQTVPKETNHAVAPKNMGDGNYTPTTTATANKKHGGSAPPPHLNKLAPTFTFTYGKPQYKKLTLFEVTASVQYDVYSLYAYNNLGVTTSPHRSASASSKPVDKHVYVSVAFISTYATSKMMNSIFRKIKENENLDYIEESDDEDDFENADPEKYVDLKKKVIMECQFNFKFKKWMPLRVVENSNGYNKIVPISNL